MGVALHNAKYAILLVRRGYSTVTILKTSPELTNYASHWNTNFALPVHVSLVSEKWWETKDAGNQRIWEQYQVDSDISSISLLLSMLTGIFTLQVWVHTLMSMLPRILDILILQDKTLFCACVDNFKQNGGFWRHCACADNFKQNGVFWRRHLPIVRVGTWPKYNKHH